MKTYEVFGISPDINEHSYIDRGSLDMELRKLLERKQTHIAICGASKSGKSWLRKRVLEDAVVVQCRLDYSIADIYRDALARLEVRLEVEKESAKRFEVKLTASGEIGAKLLAKVSGQAEGGGSYETIDRTVAIGKDHADLSFVASLLKESGKILVVEDFHYLTVDQQKRFSFDLKTLWDYGAFCIVVGVWSTQNMMIMLNPDLSERIEEISVVWSKEDLKKIFLKGCDCLNLKPSSKVVDNLAEVSYGSAGLLQKLALRYLDNELGISEAHESGIQIGIDDTHKLNDAAMHVSEQLNPLYQNFARRVSEGIRSRTNATGIYAHAMAAIMAAHDDELSAGLSAKDIFAVAHGRQNRIQLSNLKAVLTKFPSLQVDDEGRGLVLAYDPQGEVVTVVDKQLLLYRRFATVRWPWEELIDEASRTDKAFEV